MNLPHLILLLVALERIAELAVARRNTKRLLAKGGIEHGAGHYPLFVVLHAGWLAAIYVSTGEATAVRWLPVGLYAVLTGARLWVMASLGRYWTTRVISVPGAPLVRRGPYRFLRHPNYLVVSAELAVLPLAFGLWQLALAVTVLNGALVRHRIRVEERALAPRRDASRQAPAQ